MAKESGIGARFFLDGFDLSGDIGSLSSITVNRALLDVTGINKEVHERLPGLGDSEITFNGWFNPSAGQNHPTLHPMTEDRHAMYWHRATAGAPVAAMVGTQASYNVARAADGALTTVAQVMNNTGDFLDWGVGLTAGLHTSTGAENLTGVDNGAASSGEMHAYLQVTAFTGTNITFTLQSSTDNGGGDPYSAITGGAFTQVTVAPAKQRLEIAGPIERWVRVAVTGTAITTCSFAIAIRRL